MEEIKPTILHYILEAHPVTMCHFIQRSFMTQKGAVYKYYLFCLFVGTRARLTCHHRGNSLRLSGRQRKTVRESFELAQHDIRKIPRGRIWWQCHEHTGARPTQGDGHDRGQL